MRSNGGHEGRSSGGHTPSPNFGRSSSSNSSFEHHNLSKNRGRIYSHQYGGTRINLRINSYIINLIFDSIGISPKYRSMISNLIILFFILFSFLPSGTQNNINSTIERHKLENSSLGYFNNCITDEINFLSNEDKVESSLKYFYEKTGVQPMIIFKDYDVNLKTNQDKESWALKYYDNNYDQENIFLFVYFAESDPNQTGYMTYVNGYQTSSVMDSEAVNIFWNYIDRYWYSNNLSADQLIIKTYKSTADTIMKVSTTSKDILKYIIITVLIIATIGGAAYIIKMKRKAESEKAKETEEILNSSIDELVDQNMENLKDKYL